MTNNTDQADREKLHWWQAGTIYQIYPRSFQDSDGDGVGDLPGITKRLPYIQGLGIDAIWISPIYPSPMYDFGYDVSDYEDIDPLFGTLADFDALLTEAHGLGLKVLLDLVPCHTSFQHPWFIESRKSRDNPKRDWYIWVDPPPGGGPPNNWYSNFGGSAWEWDESTGQYYLHSFLVEQPDLNWRNPEVRAAMMDVMRWWLDKGIDGFRVDVIAGMIKDDQLRDNPPNPDWKEGDDPLNKYFYFYNHNRPEVHEIIREMRALVDSYGDRVLIGETYFPLETLMEYYGQNLDEAHLPFNFELILMDWKPASIQQFVEQYEAALPPGAWPNWVLGNHDRHRVASRAGLQQARVAQMLLLTLRGTPTCYYGDELGMADVPIPPDRVRDTWEFNMPGMGLGRDPERTPMQWDASQYAGFSDVEPWLPIASDYKRVNVEVECEDPSSMLSFFHDLLALRRETPALSIGSYSTVNAHIDDTMVYTREHNGDTLLVALNFGADEHTLDLGTLSTHGEILLSTFCDRTGLEELDSLRLRGNEGVIVRLVQPQVTS
jgi:alpha-glucosidase